MSILQNIPFPIPLQRWPNQIPIFDSRRQRGRITPRTCIGQNVLLVWVIVAKTLRPTCSFGLIDRTTSPTSHIQHETRDTLRRVLLNTPAGRAGLDGGGCDVCKLNNTVVARPLKVASVLISLPGLYKHTRHINRFSPVTPA